ncbi:hypothetical protein [Paraflavitalea sp. CAU 1676]|uniref:hypothetical protein n=1 Tax=Paraflavitalea sp. CAU 1676 TaxID=3032598 RepID=UPI0023DBD853|nr:hypothetical protein [Paraflavitalea sp. CAU 1676]MDF2190526.1 hypothetical protein [Paraflavitalea sp. CAU 1676]
MRNILTLILTLLGLSCSKNSTIRENPVPGQSTNIPQVLQDKADDYAYYKWSGNADATQDTVFFNYTESNIQADSTVYRREVLDKYATDAFRYVFSSEKDKPKTWENLWYFFNVQFFSDSQDTVIIFKYPLKDNSMFFF